jgi:hypothetical protein
MAMPVTAPGRRRPNRAIGAGPKAAPLLAAVVACALSVAAHADHAHTAAGEPGTFGAIAFENSCVRSVQAEFRSAVAMLHSFAAEAKQFVEVARRDPSCAIAWWGAAMAVRGNPLAGELGRDTLAAGQQYLAQAQRLKTSPRERAFIEAMEIYYRDYPNGGQLARARAYEAAMQQVFRA